MVENLNIRMMVKPYDIVKAYEVVTSYKMGKHNKIVPNTILKYKRLEIYKDNNFNMVDFTPDWKSYSDVKAKIAKLSRNITSLFKYCGLDDI